MSCMNDYNLVATDADDDPAYDTQHGLIGNDQEQQEPDADDKHNINIDLEHDGLLCASQEPPPDDDEESDANEMDAASQSQSIRTLASSLYKILHSNLFSDQSFSYGNTLIVTSPEVVKFIKFLVTTGLLIVLVFHVVRMIGMEHNPHLQLHDLYMYESNLIVQDALVYYTVGRLFRRRGCDHLSWIGWILAANIVATGMTEFKFLQHAFTLYEIHCRWPWQLFAFVGMAAPVVLGIVYAHVYTAVQRKVLVTKLVELTLCLVLFLLPFLSSPYLHLHHWYLGWLIGMHFNFDAWWSRAALAWCWGLYINGVAVYGRDPVLTCGYSFWLSEHMLCPYVDWYTMDTWGNDTDFVGPMVEPDWRNCSADAYHP